MSTHLPTTPLKKAEVCSALNISPRTLDNYVRKKLFPPGVLIGKWAYWSPSVVADYHDRMFKMQENWNPTLDSGT